MARTARRKSKSAAKKRKVGASTKSPAKIAVKTASKPGSRTASKSKSRSLKPAKSRTISDSTKPDPLDALIDAAAGALSLTIEPAWKAPVRANLQVILGQAALFAGFALPDDADPAPIFRA
jgi:Protein of unknown function (DUF4089)